MVTKTFPDLFQKTATGALQRWRIEAGEDVPLDPQESPRGYFKVTWGQVDGAQQETIDYVPKGKNAGKANATTAVQQAEKEAEAKWRKKQEREGYVEDRERAAAGERDQEGVAPMLAEVVDKINPKKLQYPADVQIKFNGNRVIVRRRGGVVKLYSRKQREITSLPHVQQAWQLALDSLPADQDLDLDGEGYRHGWSLQKISGFFKTKEPKAGHEELGHFVYDYPSHPGTWEERQRALKELFGRIVFPSMKKTGRPMEVPATAPTGVPAVLGYAPLYLVNSFPVDCLAEAWQLADHFATQRYEGGIMRQLYARYEFDRRSGVLAKLKRYKDAEFEVVGVTDGRGRYAGKAVLLLKTEQGVEFECNAPGTLEEKAAAFAEGDRLIGRWLTARFFELSDDGTPLQPTPVAWRDYE